MPTEAEELRRMVDGVGEPGLDAEASALQALLAAVAERGDVPAARARPALRRVPVLVAIALLVLCAAVAATADIGGLFSGPPAPPAVKQALRPTGHQPAWLSSEILAGQARELVRTPIAKGDLVLWIAPTRDGNLCLALQHPGERRLSPACIRPNEPTGQIGYAVDNAGGEPDGTYYAVWGRVPPGTARLALSFSDGSSEPVALTRGYFIAPIGERTPTLLVARDGSGAVRARQRIVPAGPFGLGRELFEHRRDGSLKAVSRTDVHVLIRRETWVGALKLSRGASVYGGPCTWTTIAGRLSSAQCEGSLALAHPFSYGFELSGANGRQLIVFSGQLPPDRISGARFRFADGHVVTLHPIDGYVLWAFPPITRLAAHRPVSFELLDPAGRVVRRQSLTQEGSMFSAMLVGPSDPGLLRKIHAWTRTHRW
jgi:hypothetical protein